MKDIEKWGSVRKVRYIEDIEAAIQYALQQSGKSYSSTDFANLLIEKRTERYNLINKHYDRIVTRTEKALFETKFKVTLSDTLVFMREIKVLSTKNGIVEPLELSQKTKNMNPKQKRIYILYYVLNSKYYTYSGILKNLAEKNEFTLPRYLKRDQAATDYIRKSGFATDIASFYAARDLLYELDAINWYLDERGINIFSVMPIGQNLEQFLKLSSSNIDFDFIKEAFNENQFLENLVRVYLNESSGLFMVTADLVRIRDVFCRQQRMGDFQFKELLLRQMNNESSNYKVFLSFGKISKRLSNYDLKLISLPRLSSNRLALYINLEQKGR